MSERLSSEREAEIRAEAEEGFALTDWEARGLLAALDRERALADQLAEALDHYAEELHWSLEPDDGQSTAYYPTFIYDGGNAEPWGVARASLTAYREARS